MYWYRIIHVRGYYHAQYRRDTSLGTSHWLFYSEGAKDSWGKAYAVLEKHANPAKLAVCFVGTF